MKWYDWLALGTLTATTLQAAESVEPSVEPVATTTAAVAPAAPAAPAVEDRLRDALGLFESKGWMTDANAARRAALEAIARTTDPAARLLTADEAEQLAAAARGQGYEVGVSLSMTNGLPVVTAVRPGSPAESSGLRTGDLVRAVGEVHWDHTTLPAALAALRAEATGSVRVVVQRSDGGTATVETAYAPAQQPAIAAAETWPRGLAYLKVNGLYAGRDEEIARTLVRWADEGRSGLLMDLRGAGGDDVEGAVALASLLANEGDLLFTVRDSQDQDVKIYRAASSVARLPALMVLVDRTTRGAAELLAAVLRDSVGGSLLVGEATAGDPAIREVVQIDAEDRLYLATRKVVTAQGTVYNGHLGVLPDVMVDADEALLPEFEPTAPIGDRRKPIQEEADDRLLHSHLRGDPALHRATDILKGLKALNIRAAGISSSRE